MQAKVEKINGVESLIITLPLTKGISKSGKSLTVATTNGNKSVAVNGEVITIGVNAYKANPDYIAPPKTK